MLKSVSRWYPDFRQYGSSPYERYYVAGHVTGNLSTLSYANNFIGAAPLVVPYRSRIDRVGMRVTGSAAGEARIGVYSSSANGVSIVPLNLITDSGPFSTSTTGFKTKQVDIVLEGDRLYWLALLMSANNVTISSVPVASTYPILGMDSSLGAAPAPGVGWDASFTYAAFPQTFPTPVAHESASGLPAIAYRLAA